MNYKNLFSEVEWELIKSSFDIVFELIADIDKKIDKKEKKSYFDFLNNIKKLNFQFLTELMENYKPKDELLIDTNLSELKQQLVKIKDLIDKKLEREDSVNFKKHLIAFGYYVSISSGSLFDHKFSDDEEDILNEIGFKLNISVKDLFLSGEIEKILNKLK